MRRLLFILPMAIAAFFYALTICPTIYFGDGTELTAAASVLGIPHPTGYPLYMLLGNIFLSLPFGTYGFRMNLLSMTSLMAATGLFYALAGELIAMARSRSLANSIPIVLFRVALSVAFALSLFAWRHAVQTEVYGTFLALFLAAVYLLTRAIATRSRKTFLASSFACGLAFQGHLLALILLPLLASAWLCVLFNQKQSPRNFAAFLSLNVLTFGIGISGYTYLPLRAAQHPPINWGNPQTLSAFKDHLTGGQYKQTSILSDRQTSRRLTGHRLHQYLAAQSLRIAAWPGQQFAAPEEQIQPAAALAPQIPGILLCLLALAGLGILLRRTPWLGLGLLGMIIASVAILLLYTIYDIEAYFLPLWAVMLGLIAVALATITDIRRAGMLLRSTPAAAGIALATLAALNNYTLCNLSNYTEAEAYGRKMMSGENLPKNSILLLMGDAPVFIAWYMQTVEKLRPDVTIFGASFIVHDWYRHFFERPEDSDFVFFVRDAPPHAQPDYLVALGGGIIIPNIERRPIVTIPADPWLEHVLRANWNGETIGTLIDQHFQSPPIPASYGGATMIQLHNNPEYNLYQRRQFQEQYGENAWIQGGPPR